MLYPNNLELGLGDEMYLEHDTRPLLAALEEILASLPSLLVHGVVCIESDLVPQFASITMHSASHSGLVRRTG